MSLNWTVRAEHKHAEDESPACSISNGREISAEGELKGHLKQKQDNRFGSERNTVKQWC